MPTFVAAGGRLGSGLGTVPASQADNAAVVHINPAHTIVEFRIASAPRRRRLSQTWPWGATAPLVGNCCSVATADLDDAAKTALREMIKLIRERSNLSAEDAYSLCSFAADVRISQLVNQHKGCHCMLPKAALHG